MAQLRRCTKCQILSEIHAHEMCKKCWSHEYNRKPTTKEHKRLWSQKLGPKELKRIWSQQYNQRPEVKESARIRNRLRRMNATVSKCNDCKLEKQIHRAGLCRYCYDNLRYGGRENVKKLARERTQKYRDTPAAKIKAKAYNALGSTKAYKVKFAQEWRKEPKNAKKSQRAGRKWKYTHQEAYSISNKKSCRRAYFFRAGKPVGPFDPNEILNKRLVKAIEEVREGNLKPLGRDNPYGE
jgi:hypothetical protein